MDMLPLISRILHVFSAIALVGGWIYLLVAMVPALRLVAGSLSDSIIEMANRRFYRITHLASVLLVVTGGYNWYLNNALYSQVKPLGQALIGSKALLGIIIVLIVFLSAFRVLPGGPVRWAKVNLGLATLVIVLAAVLRAVRLDAMTN